MRGGICPVVTNRTGLIILHDNPMGGTSRAHHPGGGTLATPASPPASHRAFGWLGQPHLRLLPWSAHSYCSWPGRLATTALSCTISKTSQMASSVCSWSMSRFIRREPGNKMGSWPGGTAGQSWAQPHLPSLPAPPQASPGG